MSTKIFKVSAKTKMDGLDFEKFLNTYCSGINSFSFCRESTVEDVYTIDTGLYVAKSKDSGKVKYADVCPKYPPYTSGLVIAIMDEIEKRIPPLNNILQGYLENVEKSEAFLDNIINNCKYVKDLPFTLFEESTSTLFQALQLFLDRLEYPVFCANLTAALDMSMRTFRVKDPFVDDSHSVLTKYLDSSLEKLRHEQVAMTAFIIQKIQRYSLMNVEYQLIRNVNLTKEDIYAESINFFRLLLGPVMVGLPMEHVNILNYYAHRNDIPKFSKTAAQFFANVACNASCNYWHAKSLEIFNLFNVNTDFPNSRRILDHTKTSAEPTKMKFHWH